MPNAIDTPAPLLPAVARGDIAAFEAVYDRHSSTLFPILIRILGNAEDAREVLQETFVQVWNRADQFDATRGSEIAWLVSICRNRGIDRVRSRRLRETPESDAGREISRPGSNVVRTGADDALRNEEYSLLATALDPVAPPPEVRENILSTVRNTDRVVEKEASGQRLLFRRTIRRPWLAATAAVFFLALWGWSELRLRALREDIDEVHAGRELALEESRRLERTNKTLIDEVGALSAPTTRTITLSGQKASPSATARVFLDGQKRRAFVFFHDLPASGNDKSYQLWIIRAGKPQPESVSVFEVDEKGQASVVLENLPTATEIKGLAVTLEPRGGAPAPTGQKYLSGS